MNSGISEEAIDHLINNSNYKYRPEGLLKAKDLDQKKKYLRKLIFLHSDSFRFKIKSECEEVIPKGGCPAKPEFFYNK